MSEGLLENHRKTLRQVANFLGVRARGFDTGAVIGKTREPIVYPSVITQGDRDYLREIYSSDVEQFASVSGLDIGRWKSFG
jgi:small ligand-binding sensory domain FIST